jgi:hypothetical protein
MYPQNFVIVFHRLLNFADLGRSHPNNGFVKSNRSRRAKTEERGALTGAPQRFTPLGIFPKGVSSLNIRRFIPEFQEPNHDLTGQGCPPTPQMDFLRDH